jgi:hypothetical protein
MAMLAIAEGQPTNKVVVHWAQNWQTENYDGMLS